MRRSEVSRKCVLEYCLLQHPNQTAFCFKLIEFQPATVPVFLPQKKKNHKHTQDAWLQILKDLPNTIPVTDDRARPTNLNNAPAHEGKTSVSQRL